MARRKIGQEELRFAPRESSRRSLLVDLVGLIDWAPLAVELDGIHSASKGEPAWPPLALFKALLLAVWYDLSDVKLAEAHGRCRVLAAWMTAPLNAWRFSN